MSTSKSGIWHWKVKLCLLLSFPSYESAISRANLGIQYPNLLNILTPNISHSLLPRLIHSLATKHLPLLQKHLVPPLRLINRIHIPTRLHTEARTLSLRRPTINLWDVNVLARVELEGRLGAVHFQMQASAAVVELREAAQGQAARVQGDLGRVGFHDEDVVDVGPCRGEDEGGCYVPGELGDSSCRDAGGIQGEIVCCGELGGCAGDGGTVAEVEVAGG